MREDILRELYETHYHSAYLYALSLCKEKAWAEDIVSDAFERAMVTLEEGGQGFRYWLLRVCKNLFLDEVRRMRHRSGETLPEVAVPEDALATALRREENRRLYHGIAALPQRYAELLTLYYFAGLSLQQAADFLGISYGAAKTALFRARVQLRQRLEEDGYDL